MKFNLYKDVKSMYQSTYDILVKKEVLNSVLLSNLIIGNAGIDTRGWRDTTNWFMATITDDSKIKLIALMTPPFNLTLYEVEKDEKSVSCLIEGIISNNIVIHGVMCERNLAEEFALEYTKRTNLEYKVVKKQGIYELEKINPDLNIIGILRPFKESDLSFVPYWVESAKGDFHNVTINKVSNNINDYTSKELYILENNGIPVSFARITREMKTCCCVSMVYTPPYFRNYGYATSCVAGISQIILNRGFNKCVLYTDLDYPISNSIYKKIGYVHVFNSLEISFIAKE